MIEGNYKDIIGYLSNLIKSLETHAYDMQYQEFKEPVYRGINHSHISIDDYPINSVRSFPSFTSTSADLYFSVIRSWTMGNKEGAMIFKIYLN
jgi:hypothetical protein